jgi:hypothetical protein
VTRFLGSEPPYELEHHMDWVEVTDFGNPFTVRIPREEYWTLNGQRLSHRQAQELINDGVLAVPRWDRE